MRRNDIKRIADNMWGRYKIKSTSFKYNQLVQNGNFESTSGYGYYGGTISTSNNKLTLTKTKDGNDSLFKSCVLTPNHKYLYRTTLTFEANTNYNLDFWIGGGSYKYFDFEGNKKTDVSFIIDNLTTQNGYIYIYLGGMAVNTKMYEENLMIIDLTELFGAGNEPTTLEQFYATDLGQAIQKGFYPPYSPTNTIYTATAPLTFKYDSPAMTSLYSKKNINPSGQEWSLSLVNGVGELTVNSSWSGNKFAQSGYTPSGIISTHKYYYFAGNINTSIQISYYINAGRYASGYGAILNGSQIQNEAMIYRFDGTNLPIGTYRMTPVIIDLTDIGLDNLTAQQFYDQYKDKFEQLANGETAFKPQTVSILQNGQPLKIGGIGTAKDYYLNASGKVNRALVEIDLGGTYAGWSKFTNNSFYINLARETLAKKTGIVNLLCSKYEKLNVSVGLETIVNYPNTIGQNSGNKYIYFYSDETASMTVPQLKTFLSGVQLSYELATPTTEQANSVMLRKGYTKCYDKNNLELEIEDLDAVLYNQFIPNNLINLSSNTSTSPSTNLIGSYISILNPIPVGHKVYAKITPSDAGVRLVWYKNGTSGYDFVTGQLVNTSSEPVTATEGIYEITSDMIYTDGYMQLYYFINKNCPTGTHTIKVQLIDLTNLGMENIINPVIFKATKLGKLLNKGVTLNFTNRENVRYGS